MNSITIQQQIEKLAALSCEKMYQDDFLLTWDRSDDEIAAVFETADILRAMRS
jgi:hypothetical protein